MNDYRIGKEYERGVFEFLEYVKEHAKLVNETYFCPYVRCLNQVLKDLDNIRDHLFIYGIMRSYTIWTWHGEVLYHPKMSRGSNYVDKWMSGYLEEMVRDVGKEKSNNNIYELFWNNTRNLGS
ncbi:hypothetical protein V8G54_035262 [Vigna mungo]|uniref:Transposase-associated domain-containing protein n=1 Tax=Vigna mungo TaxID=3915 RepID=A0AAQ3RAJ2_VIGMU